MTASGVLAAVLTGLVVSVAFVFAAAWVLWLGLCLLPVGALLLLCKVLPKP